MTARVGDTCSSAGKTEPPASPTPCNTPLPPLWAVLVLTCPAPSSAVLLRNISLDVPRRSQLGTDSPHRGWGHLIPASFVYSLHDTKLEAIPTSLGNIRPKQTCPRGLLPRDSLVWPPRDVTLEELREQGWGRDPLSPAAALGSAPGGQAGPKGSQFIPQHALPKLHHSLSPQNSNTPTPGNYGFSSALL